MPDITGTANDVDGDEDDCCAMVTTQETRAPAPLVVMHWITMCATMTLHCVALNVNVTMSVGKYLHAQHRHV
jgi:hypothetical protein